MVKDVLLWVAYSPMILIVLIVILIVGLSATVIQSCMSLYKYKLNISKNKELNKKLRLIFARLRAFK